MRRIPRNPAHLNLVGNRVEMRRILDIEGHKVEMRRVILDIEGHRVEMRRIPWNPALRTRQR